MHSTSSETAYMRLHFHLWRSFPIFKKTGIYSKQLDSFGRALLAQSDMGLKTPYLSRSACKSSHQPHPCLKSWYPRVWSICRTNKQLGFSLQQWLLIFAIHTALLKPPNMTRKGYLSRLIVFNMIWILMWILPCSWLISFWKHLTGGSVASYVSAINSYG